MRIRHAMAYATHTFFHNHGFLYIHTPIITGADCEGAGEQFGVTTMLGSDHLMPEVPEGVEAEPEDLLKEIVKKDPYVDRLKAVSEDEGEVSWTVRLKGE